MRFKKFFGKMMIAAGVAAMTFTFAGSTALADGVNTDFDIRDEAVTEADAEGGVDTEDVDALGQDDDLFAYAAGKFEFELDDAKTLFYVTKIIDEDMTEFNIPSSLRVGGLYYYYAPGGPEVDRSQEKTIVTDWCNVKKVVINNRAYFPKDCYCVFYKMKGVTRYYRKPNYVVYH
ncbi:MAG: hypothetical protein K6E28_03650 [Eubacterium sp.]|nr:hypothetical protein [Eubacterium sp.]